MGGLAVHYYTALSDAGEPGMSTDTLRPTGHTDNLTQPKGVLCTLCGRSYARGRDLTYHNCLEDRLKPVMNKQA